MIPDVQLATSITPLVDKILVPSEHNHNHRIRKCPFSELPFRRSVLDSRTVHFLESHCNTPWGNTSHSNSDRIKPCCVLPRTNKQKKNPTNLNKCLFFSSIAHLGVIYGWLQWKQSANVSIAPFFFCSGISPGTKNLYPAGIFYLA